VNFFVNLVIFAEKLVAALLTTIFKDNWGKNKTYRVRKLRKAIAIYWEKSSGGQQ